MARISGTTALRAALGGIAGGLRGLGAMREEQRLLAQQEEARKRQLAADARQAAMDQVGLFNQGFMTGEETAGERQRTGAALSRALSSATAMMAPGAGMGGAMPSLQPGDVRRTAAAPGLESPQQRVTLGGVSYQRESPFAKAAREAEQEVNRARMADEATQATQRQTREQQKRALVGMGLSEDQAEAALSMGAKYSDIAETPADRQRRLIDERRLGLEARRLSLAERAAGGGAGSKEQSAMQQMMVARVNTARLQAAAANAEMEKFEEDLISGKRKIGAIEAQLANEMFKDTRFNRIAEAQLNRMNPALAMYVRNAKAIGAAERLVMPRGGSNLLMNIETALAGVGPGATPELIRNTQAFRRGLVEGVQKETPEALMEAENARVESAIGTDAERRGAPAAGAGDAAIRQRLLSAGFSEDEITQYIARGGR